MAKPIVVSWNGAESSFDHAKLNRSKLYGRRRRMALDAKGEPCKRASLTEDGRYLLRSGMTAQGYFTEEGEWVANKELVGIDAEGNVVEKAPSTLGAAQDLAETSAEELLDHRVVSTYMLEPTDVDDALKAALEEGRIVRFAFNYRADFNVETGFLLSNEHGIFALIGNPEVTEWLDAEAGPVLVEEEDDDDDDLDFEMF